MQTTSVFYQWNETSNPSTLENISFTPNGLNQYDTVIGANGNVLTSYDNSANLTRLGPDIFSYDALNRLTFATVSDAFAVLNYDAADRLIRFIGQTSGETEFIYDGDAIIGERAGDRTMLRRYVHGPGVDNPIVCVAANGGHCIPTSDPDEKLWMLSDIRGSLITYVGETPRAGDGMEAEVGTGRRNVYDIFGQMGSNNVGRFAYTGQIYLPEIGLISLGPIPT